MKLVEVKTVPIKPNLVIEFTPEDCEVLTAICAKVGGDPESYRGKVDKLLIILSENGYKDYEATGAYKSISSSRMFFE